MPDLNTIDGLKEFFRSIGYKETTVPIFTMPVKSLAPMAEGAAERVAERYARFSRQYQPVNFWHIEKDFDWKKEGF